MSFSAPLEREARVGHILCSLLGHRVDKGRVWFDDIDFRTTCGRCRRPLIRAEEGWRPFDSGRDLPVGGPPRRPHPRHRV